MNRILLIDDDRTIGQSLQLLATKAGYELKYIINPGNATEFIAQYQPDLLLLDMNFTIDTSGEQGISLLRQFRVAFPDLPIILITGWGSMELAIEGMKAGAKDFITKPWNNEQLLQSIDDILQLQHSEQLAVNSSLDSIIGQSKEIQEVKAMIQKVAGTNASVLITGESGTGKELVAEAIHDLSQRSKNAFVKVNLGGLTESLFESELFGYKKGAFTGAMADREGRFAMADGGSIFLDEIGEVSLAQQVKLLRVLQEKTFEPLGSSKPVQVDFRLISATHQPLQQLIADYQFREDLYYRINLIQIHLPPLRERREDIALIAENIIQKFNQLMERPAIQLSSEAKEWLTNQEFSGNVRQLKNNLERAVILADSSKRKLMVSDLKPHFEANNSPSSTNPYSHLTIDEMEEQMIRKALHFHHGNVSLAAESLGITRSALYRRLEKYQIERD